MKALPCRSLLMRLSDYIDGALDAPSCRQVESHLPSCRPCKVFIKTLRKTVAALRASGRRAPLPASLRRDLLAKLKRCVASS